MNGLRACVGKNFLEDFEKLDADFFCLQETKLQEGRVITLEYKDFYMVTVYTPNAQNELARLDYRMEWEDDFRKYLDDLAQKKGVIVCGDMNVAHEEIDLKNPKTNRKKFL